MPTSGECPLSVRGLKVSVIQKKEGPGTLAHLTFGMTTKDFGD